MAEQSSITNVLGMFNTYCNSHYQLYKVFRSDYSSKQCCGLNTIFTFLLSSAYRKNVQNFATFFRLSVYDINNRGPRDNTWGIPEITLCSVDVALLTVT